MNRHLRNRTHEERSELLKLYKERKNAIRRRLRDFCEVSSSDYFYELMYCLMTPQTSAEHADRVVGILKEVNFETEPVDPEPILNDKRHYIRFHRTKAQHLQRAKSEFSGIAAALQTIQSPIELREWLVVNVLGFGYKEATHFLRNIGRNGGLAILDRHILKNLHRYGAIRSLPRSMTRKQYQRIERRFIAFSDRIGIPVDELDLLFWSMETGEIRK